MNVTNKGNGGTSNLDRFRDYPPLEIIDGREIDKAQRQYLADFGRMVASGAVGLADAYGILNRALASAQIPDEKQVQAIAYFQWYAENKAPPANALQSVWGLVTDHINRLTPPGWCATPYAPLYFAALILGVNGRVFPFACPALSSLSGLKRGSVLHFRRIACAVGFMTEIQAGQQGGAASLFALIDEADQTLLTDVPDFAAELHTRCPWLFADPIRKRRGTFDK